MWERIADGIAVSQWIRVNRIQPEILVYADEDDSLSHLRNAQPLGIKKSGLHTVAGFLQSFEHIEEPAFCRAFDQPADVLGDTRTFSMAMQVE